jgi:GTPase SAR1 family protein
MTEVRFFVMGEGGVGKSALCLQYVQNHFVEEYDPYYDDSFRKQIELMGETYLLDIYDSFYEEEYSAMREQWIRQAQVFFVCFDVNRRSTFDEVERYLEMIARVKDVELHEVRDKPVDALRWCDAEAFPHVILVGTKGDLAAEQREVLFEEADALARKHGLFGFVETSSKVRANVESIFELGILCWNRSRKFSASRSIRVLAKATQLKLKIDSHRSSRAPWNWARRYCISARFFKFSWFEAPSATNASSASRVLFCFSPRPLTSMFERYSWNRKLKQLSSGNVTQSDALLFPGASASETRPITISLPKTAVELQRERVLDSLDILESEIFGDIAAMFSVCNPSLKVARTRAAYSGGLAPGSVAESVETSHSLPDAVVIVGTAKVFCHRFILALRSEFFRSVLAPEKAAKLADERQRLVDTFDLPDTVLFACDLTNAHAEMTQELGADLVRMMYDPWVKPTSQNLPTLLSLRSINDDLLHISGLAAVLATMVSVLTEQDAPHVDASAQGDLRKTQAIFTDSRAIREAMIPGLAEFEHLSDVLVEVVVTEDDDRTKLKRGDVQQFRLHRAFVSARSQWFAALLAENAATLDQSDTPITRIDPETLPAEIFECVVEYLYCGRPSESMDPNRCLDVLSAANMLQLPRLEQICEQLLEPLIDEATVVSLWLAADFHGATRLVDRCDHFMCRYWDRISSSGNSGVSNGVKDLPKDTRKKCKAAFQTYVEARQGREREEQERAEKLAQVKTYLAIPFEKYAIPAESRPWTLL